MRRLTAVAAAVATLLLVDLSCNGGVNPGQIHEHQHEGPLPVHCRRQVGATCYGATPGAELAAWSCEGVNILIEPSMVRVGFPHHPGSQVEGKVRIVAGACPPTSGTVTAWLQRYSFPPLGSPPGTPGSWHVAAGPRSVSVAGIEAPRTIRFLDAVCRPHHWWRLRIHGEDITDQGVPTSFTRCWPGGGVSWRCLRGRQGRFYLSCG